MKKNKYFFSILILTSILSALLFISCGDDTSDKNAEKLKMEQEIQSEKDNLQKQKEEITQRGIEIEELLRQKKLDETINLITTLENRKKIIEDSLINLTDKLIDANSRIETLLSKKMYVAETKEKSHENVNTKISELEASINSLIVARTDEENKQTLIAKRKDLISKKSDLLKTELEFKKSELDNLYSQQDAQNQINEINENITSITAEIDQYKNLLLEEELNLKLSQNKISDLSNQILEKQLLFKTEYEKGSGLTDFVNKESDAIDKEIRQLEGEKELISKKWKILTDQRGKINAELTKNRKLKSSLLGNEEEELADSSVIAVPNDSDSVKALVQTDTLQSKDEENSSAEKLLEESKQTSEGSNYLFYIIILLVILVFSGLYWLGKKNRKKTDK